MSGPARVWRLPPASITGFFEQGRNRLVRPGIAVREEGEAREPETSEDSPTPKNKNGGDDGFGNQDALIIGLFRKLPQPAAEWAEEDRLKWLQTAANIFDLVYQGDCGGFVITPARAERSPRPRDH